MSNLIKKKIEETDINKLDLFKEKIENTALTFSGQGILINRENTVGILVRSYLNNDLSKIKLINKGIIDGSLQKFKKNTISMGKDLAISLNLVVGEQITLMSTSNLQTPFGNLPLQEKFTISSIFSTGLAEFDQNVVFMPFENANSLFELQNEDIDLEIFLNKPDEVEIIKNRIWIMAIKNIKKNQELNYNYGYAYDTDYTEHVCKCGSNKCVGFILNEEDWPKLKRNK